MAEQKRGQKMNQRCPYCNIPWTLNECREQVCYNCGWPDFEVVSEDKTDRYSQPSATTLNNLLTIISMRQDWISRRELALVLDRPGLALNVSDWNSLKQLEYDGLIEGKKVGLRYEYRAIEK